MTTQNTFKTVRIGMMPGRINEYALEAGTTVADALALADINATDGFEVKVDGVKVDVSTAVITNETNLVLVAKLVKGNSNTVRIGQMPGRIEEYAIDESTTVAEALELAGLSADGFEVKADGTKVTDLNAPVGSTNLLLLAKLVKGNSGTVRIGQMPGRISEYAVDPSSTFNDVITLAELNAEGFEVKADGVKVTDLDSPIGSTSLILLAKLVKGNK